MRCQGGRQGTTRSTASSFHPVDESLLIIVCVRYRRKRDVLHFYTLSKKSFTKSIRRSPIWLLRLEPMPTLFPPLEPQEESSVLPADLKANFEAIQAIIRAQSRLKNEERAGLDATNVGKKRKNPADIGSTTVDTGDQPSVNADHQNDRLESCKLQLAVETAVAVENEISLLKNGIAELEALLLQQGDGINATEIEFPTLPSIVPDDLEKVVDSCDVVGEADVKEELDVISGTK